MEKFYIGVKFFSLFFVIIVKGKVMEVVDYYVGKLLFLNYYYLIVDEDFLKWYCLIELEIF